MRSRDCTTRGQARGTGKRLPVTQTELRLIFKHPPRLGFGVVDRAPQPNQLVVFKVLKATWPLHCHGMAA